MYRFYTGDVYAGEWSNGQSHGYGVHTCEDGSRYIGEFKRGVKHGLGHYHFRCETETCIFYAAHDFVIVVKLSYVQLTAVLINDHLPYR